MQYITLPILVTHIYSWHHKRAQHTKCCFLSITEFNMRLLDTLEFKTRTLNGKNSSVTAKFVLQKSIYR
jgi:hypothetical protein